MRTTIALAFLAISLHTNALAQPVCADPLSRTAYLMGTTLRVSACGGREAAVKAIEAGFQEVARLEAVLSSWKPTTEIGRINSAAPGAQLAVSAELATLLSEAAEWVAATDGAFDPAVGALIDVWGFRTEPRVPEAASLAHARESTGWKLARLDKESIVRGPDGWWIDTGGFGKGAALRNLVRVLRAHGVREAIIDFGGQLQIVGQEVDVSVADPADRDRAAMTLRVKDVAVSTSSQSERYIEHNGRKYGHIVDPRTGRPVAAWGSVTVVAGDALAADALSTALFVMGPKKALAWAEQHPDIGVLVLESGAEGIRATWSRALNQWIVEES